MKRILFTPLVLIVILILFVGGLASVFATAQKKTALFRMTWSLIDILEAREPLGNSWIATPTFIDFDQGDFHGEATPETRFRVARLLIDDATPIAELAEVVAHQWAHALVWSHTNDDKVSHDYRWGSAYEHCLAVLAEYGHG